ncbi:MAG: hypothetical protein KJ731_08915 [Alphaproteobacteria bacterium]|nr:hypothetical protein [Alphaproteobacteria bacterium]MBU1279005.1 hypothetical protein [Alphaproteobacteria bacterium]MBU1573070.1 hypothetical protein [Alphaproteobacteria bacterium]MBU1828583.1 hypothetical protein [Alphaproteobacteria bacterium]MBU2080038.1 hypothetical protein [Alphaproteobacteria bacterium]
MAKQDDWTRITLRLPRDLHARITAAVGAASLNATIVTSLEERFPVSAEDKLKALLEEYDHAMNEDNPNKENLRQLYDWGVQILERGLRTEKQKKHLQRLPQHRKKVGEEKDD